MLVEKSHYSIVLGSITFPTDNFQLNLTCFYMVAKKDFATVLDACWQSVVFITPPRIWPRERNTCICWIGGTVGQRASLDTVEKREISCPTSIQKSDRLTTAYSLIGYAIPAPTEISKYWSISCMNIQSRCIMVVTLSQWNRTWTTNHSLTVKHNQENYNLSTLSKEYAFKIYNLELPTKRLHVTCIRKIWSYQIMTAEF